MDPYRLPGHVVPSRYDLQLTPDLPSASFRGEVTISIDVREPTQEVILNAAELRVAEAVCQHGGRESRAEVVLDEAAERLHLRFAEALPTGPARLRLEFQGTLNDKLRGFYRSRYRHPAGDDRWLAATQFEATDARRAFPCWDEPAFKAVFSTTLVIDPALRAISNTRVVEEQDHPSGRLVRFADTMPMSTYLVAFLVGEFVADEAAMVGKTPLSVWTVPGKGTLTRFARDIAASSLRFFEEYYDLPYPGDKLDLIAVPDFAAGAMENFGAITFRETALLLDERLATHQERERVADVVAHENAHMWFGDLVTMRWWNGLWLNEAFATFMQMLAVDAWRPGWRRWETFSASRAAALAIDGLLSSRPVEFPVHAPADAEAMFDVLTYDKGAAVLRMLEQHLGPDVFRAGVRLYLKTHAYGNAETRDLWDALAEASGLPIPEVMDRWVFQTGYPVLSARRVREGLALTQQRFTYLPSPAGDASPPWQVPVRLRIDTLSGTEERHLVLAERETRLPLPADTRLVLVNAGGDGFYRVRYDPELQAGLLGRLPALQPAERFNLVNDAWAGVLAGLGPVSGYLDLTARLAEDGDRNVWSVLLAAFTVLSRIVEEEDRPAFQRLVRARLAPMVRRLGWRSIDGEDELTGQLRGDLLRAAGTLGDDPAVQAEAALVFAGSQAEAAVQAAAVAVLAHAGDAARFDDFLARFRAAGTPQEENRFLMALAAFRPAALVDRALAASLDGTARTQDAPLMLRALLLGAHSRERAWEFFQKRWDEMAARFPGPGIRRLCEGVAGLTSERWLGEVEAFFQERGATLGGRTLEQFLEQLRVTVELRRREGKALAEYLQRAGEEA
ncbi:MAG: M1 family metallopeptidase [Gemmataceae bacterium]